MPVKLINDELTNQIKNLFDVNLKLPIKILYFYSLNNCDNCDEVEQLLDEIGLISHKIKIMKYEINKNQSIAQRYNIQLTPGLVIAGNNGEHVVDYGIRFAGIPSGYEFGSLIQAILLVSKRDSGLKPPIREALKSLTAPVRLQVFVTPT